MILAVLISLLDKRCVYVSNKSICKKFNYADNQIDQVQNNIFVMQQNQIYFFTESCEFEYITIKPENDATIYFQSFSTDVIISILNKIYLNIETLDFENISAILTQTPVNINGRKSIIKSHRNFGKANFDLFTTSYFTDRATILKVSFEDYQSVKSFNVSAQVFGLVLCNIPRNSSVFISDEITSVKCGKFQFESHSFCDEIHLVDSRIYFNMLVIVNTFEMKLRLNNSEIIFMTNCQKNSFLVQESTNSILTFKTNYCPPIISNQELKLNFHKNITYYFNSINCNNTEIEAPKGTILEIGTATSLNAVLCEGVAIKITKEILNGNIKGVLILPKKVPSTFNVTATEIIFENTVISVPDNQLIQCTKASGTILVNLHINTERQQLFRIDKDGNISSLILLPMHELHEGEAIKFGIKDAFVDIWIECTILEWHACVSEDINLCSKTSKYYHSIEEFKNSFNANNFNNIFIESFVNNEIPLNIKHSMNVKLYHGTFVLNGHENIDTLFVINSTISSADNKSISCKKYYTENSTSNNPININTDYHLALYNQQYNILSRKVTIHVKSFDADLLISENLILLSDGMVTFENNDELNIVMEDLNGSIAYPETLNSLVIKNCNVQIIINNNYIKDNFQISDSNITFSLSKYNTNELMFNNTLAFSNVLISTNVPFIYLLMDCNLSEKSIMFYKQAISYKGKVRLESNNADLEYSLFNELTIASNEVNNLLGVTDRIYLENPVAELNLSGGSLRTDKRLHIYMNYSSARPTFINILSGSKYIPPKIHIRNIDINENDLNIFIPLICSDVDSFSDIDISYPEIYNYLIHSRKREMTKFLTKISCAGMFIEKMTIDSKVPDTRGSWIGMSVGLSLGFLLLVTFIIIIATLNRRRYKRIPNQSINL